jgi:hypothetical protein
LSYAAAYRGRSESVSADRLLRREGHPLGVRRYYEDPAEEDAQAAGVHKKWTFGVAAGALLVAGTFAAGALGLNGASLPLVGDNAPEHAPSAPGHGPTGSQGPGDIGTPAVAAPPHGGHNQDLGKDRADRAHDAAAHGAQPGATGGSGAAASQHGAGGQQATPAPPAAPATPAPAPSPAPAQQQQPGTVAKVVKPVTDTVGNVTRPVTDTVGNVLSPVTGVLTGGGDQPALTMIDPLGDLLGS